MSGSKKMILRVQSPEGTRRVEVSAEEATAALYERVYAALELASFAFSLHKDRQRREEIVSSKSQRLCDYDLRHGDMLYLSPVNGAVLFDQPSTSADTGNKITSDGATASTSKSNLAPSLALPSADTLPSQPSDLQQDEVDIELSKESGLIQRQRDEKLCRHNSNGRCVHCSPLEPWDENYLKEHNIKHMSFQSYLRKIQSKNFISLNELSFKIKPGCREHPAWPRGICSKCQPGPVTLARQQYRHVDNVCVEHPAVVERFLSYWRCSGHQRLGLLFGRVERHDAVPLGVRATVAAVYEPPQVSSRDGLALAPDPRAGLVRALAAELGLRPVGWMFTDLLPLDAGAGTVRRLRGADTHFLSAQECLTAAHYQNLHPNACPHSPSGRFGSKFVTVCVTGDESNRVHLEGYQVSQQAAALARDGLLLPTKDAPELAYVRDGGDALYAPDVHYKERDAYGNEVSAVSRRVPVAYLLVDVPCGVGSGGAPSLSAEATFPPANRALQQHLQHPAALHAALRRAPFLRAASDLHLLLYLASNEALAVPLEELRPLLAAVRRGDAAAADAWRRGSARLATLERLAQAAHEAAHEPPAPLAPPDAALDEAVWTCRLCTFHNAARHDACDMCAMPRNAGSM